MRTGVQLGFSRSLFITEPQTRPAEQYGFDFEKSRSVINKTLNLGIFHDVRKSSFKAFKSQTKGIHLIYRKSIELKSIYAVQRSK